MPQLLDLCGSCGLCCNGTLFGRSALAKDELDHAARHLTVIDHDGRPFLALPCRAHRGDACAIYRERPKTCRSFRCHLLQDHEDGTVGDAAALAVIARARALATSIRATLPPERSNEPLFDAAEVFVAHVDADHAALLLDLAALTQLCRARFGVPIGGTMTSEFSA